MFPLATTLNLLFKSIQVGSPVTSSPQAPASQILSVDFDFSATPSSLLVYICPNIDVLTVSLKSYHLWVKTRLGINQPVDSNQTL